MIQINYDPVNVSKNKCFNNNDNAKCQNNRIQFAWKLYNNRNSLLIFFFLWRALQHPYDIVLTYVLFHVLSQNLFLLNIFVLK